MGWKSPKSSPSRQVRGDKPISWDFMRFIMNEIAKDKDEFCGLPTPIMGQKLILEPRHPYAQKMNEILAPETENDDGGLSLINVFYSHAKRCDIYIWRDADGKIGWGLDPAIHHLGCDLSTMGCSPAWSVEAEIKAMKLLRTLIPKHLFEMYFLTGMFLERSKRSQVTYIFRRLKPTVALKAFRGDSNKSAEILCCLCLHPLGYYAESWAGALCPTDDVIGHLLLMRGDEKMYWRRANQISAHRPNAGL